MKNWKIVIERNGKPEIVTISADSYADAYIKAGIQFPGSEIKSITEIREK